MRAHTRRNEYHTCTRVHRPDCSYSTDECLLSPGCPFPSRMINCIAGHTLRHTSVSVKTALRYGHDSPLRSTHHMGQNKRIDTWKIVDLRHCSMFREKRRMSLRCCRVRMLALFRLFGDANPCEEASRGVDSGVDVRHDVFCVSIRVFLDVCCCLAGLTESRMRCFPRVLVWALLVPRYLDICRERNLCILHDGVCSRVFWGAPLRCL